MKVLHICRSEPDDTVQRLLNVLNKDGSSKVTALYDGRVDWSALVDDIFFYDKVICWW